ncbi:progranulin-like isoform X2 [Periophthalmus magnuspinnatus]|uniref:progranulin-like isoform X2 n=1 Tax=Periophthalmus magnuspinnatus TaxID=409849 RepID=UPI002436FA3B|nr:progranulin-like isoform X2 [Periophthalmus magnuspinnatus]
MQRCVVTCFLALLVCVVWADECPGGGRCREGQTCCKHPEHGYECCPFDQAECCGDHVHCCPAGMTCEVEQSRCVNASLSVPWAERTPTWQREVCKSFRMIKSSSGEDGDNICPDQSRCPDEFSCLKSFTKYGCCPLAQGVPCSDGKHCCAQGHSCSEDGRSCIKKDVSSTVLCSDGISECPEESSCCEGADGEFGCCPMTRAVCCDDKTHCCPEGSLCDLQSSKCVSVTTKKELPMWAKFPARRRAEWENQKELQATSETVDVLRPGAGASNVSCDSTKSCKDEETCCSAGEGSWFCCPAPNAVCCSDHQHCCPAGFTCDVAHLRCVNSFDATPVMTLQKAVAVKSQESAPEEGEKSESEEEEDDKEEDDEEGRVHCSNQHACPRNSTCCRLGHRRWGCCPLPKAVCCFDGKHCCPHRHQCHHLNKACVKDGVEIPWYTKLPAITKPKPPVTVDVLRPGAGASNISCDSTKSCKDEETCCSAGEGSWFCCPAPNAVCCTDHQHCCPAGYQCDLAQQMCVQSSVSTPFTTTQNSPTPTPTPTPTPAPQVETQESASEEGKKTESEETISSPDSNSKDVQCEDRSSCPDHNTCCQLASGEYGCCPLENAVCCPDKLYCCPQGYSCDGSGGCVQSVYVQMMTVPLTTPKPEPEDKGYVMCGQNSCLKGSKCCRNNFCCPYLNGVCCRNGCCPFGQSCSARGGCSIESMRSWVQWLFSQTEEKKTFML